MCIGLTISEDSEDANISSSSEERKRTGRMVAVIGALMLLGLAMYHAWIRKTAVLAGVIVPAAIMILYAAWVVFLTKRDKKRFLSINESEMQSTDADLSLTEVVTTAPVVSEPQAQGNLESLITEKPSTSKLQTHTHGHYRSDNAKRKHHKFLKTKKKLLEQQRQMKNLEPPIAKPLHRSRSVS